MNLPKETLLKLIWIFFMSLDKLFILGGKQLKSLIPVWYTAFCTLGKWTEGRYRSEQCLVLIECTTELDLNIFKLFILGGKQLKSLIPVWYTLFCTLGKWAEGRYRSEQCLVLIECTTKLDLNIFIFLTTKSNKESVYCECRGRMFNFLNSSRQYVTYRRLGMLHHKG